MPKAFISYTHGEPDSTFADGLAHHLRENGVEVFIDTDIRLADNWVEKIEDHLGQADFLILLISKLSITSDMVLEEVRRAHERKRAGDLRFVPVRLDYTGALPYDLGGYLSRIQYTTWQPGAQPEAVYAEIVTAIQSPEPDLLPDSADSAEAVAQMAEAIHSGPPLPSFDARLETGTVRADSPFYVRRSEDDRIEELLALDDGRTIVVGGPRQVGKSSLLAMAQAWAEEHHYLCCYITFQGMDPDQLDSLPGLLKYLAAKLHRDLDTALHPKDVWDDFLGHKESFAVFVEDAILRGADSQVVLFFDEVDLIFRRDYSNSFFGMLRSWHENRARRENWNKLNILIGHATDPSTWIEDDNQSPFNVGVNLYPEDLTPAHVRRLIERHEGLDVAICDAVIDLCGGQPYLIRRALYAVAKEDLTVAELATQARTERSPFRDHLNRFRIHLERKPKLALAMKLVIRDNRCDDEDDFQSLRAAGLIAGDTKNDCRTRCGLYREYFERHL